MAKGSSANGGGELRQRHATSSPSPSPSAAAAASPKKTAATVSTASVSAPESDSESSDVASSSSSTSWLALLLALVFGAALGCVMTVSWGFDPASSPSTVAAAGCPEAASTTYPFHSLVHATYGHVASTQARLVPNPPQIWQRASAGPRLAGACVPPFLASHGSSNEEAVYTAQYRGEAHTGQIALEHARRMPSLNNLRMLWIVEGVNMGIHTASKGSPIVARDVPLTRSSPPSRTLFVGSDNGRLYALDADTGAQRWVHHVRPARFGIHGTPAVDAERVYIGQYGGWLSALDRRTGALIWETQVGQSIGASPVLIGERVCTGVEINRPRANGYVACLAKRTGQVLFYSPELGDHTHATPTPIWRTGKRVQDWSNMPPAPGAVANTASKKAPTKCNWTALCRPALSELERPFTPAALVEFEAASCQAGSPFAGEVRAAALLQGESSVPLPSGGLGPSVGLLLLGANTGVLSAVDASTGAIVWSFACRGARVAPLLKAIQKVRIETMTARADRRERAAKHREQRAAKRLEAARGNIAEDEEWTQEDEDSFWAAEEQRAVDEETEEEAQDDRDAELENERQPKDHEAWILEDTTMVCINATKDAAMADLCSSDLRPWFHLLLRSEGSNRGQIKGTVATSGRLVIFTSWDSFVYALDANTGAQVWSTQTRSLAMSSPAVLSGRQYAAATGVAPNAAATEEDHEQGLVFIGTHENAAYALDLASGREVWRVRLGGKMMSSGILSHRPDSLEVVTICGGGNSARAWVLSFGAFDGTLHDLCAFGGEELSRLRFGSGAISGELALHEHTLYASTNGGRIIALAAP